MSNIVTLHHNIVVPGAGSNSSSASGGILSVGGVAWGNNALQTITIARHTPFNPQQAIGYKGIVDYTSSPVTSDLTLDCILTEDSDEATSNSSIYNHAETEVVIGQESYVLTSCNINFQAGNPATVNYGYITAGLASEMITTANPELLTAGEEAAFAVVMGSDGTGIDIESLGETVIPAGAQTVGFTCSLNRNQILDIRSSSPVQFITTYPLDLSMNLELLQKIAGDSLTDLYIKAGADATVTGAVAGGHPSTSSAGKANAGKYYVKAKGLKLTESGDSINVGGNLTYTYNYTAADICIPLSFDAGSNSGS